MTNGTYEMPFGKTVHSKTNVNVDIERNTPGSLNKNYLILCQQGGGKTNLLMLFVRNLIQAYKRSEGEYGALPIVFSPLFEFEKLRMPSDNTNLPPETEPETLDINSYTFYIAEPPQESKIKIIYFPFRELTVEDIAGLAGYNEDNKILGFIQKLLERLQKINPYYDIDDFLKVVEEDKSLKDALYYVFTKLKKSGLFDSQYHKFDWYESIKEGKPVVFHFGSINSRDLYSSLTGILLRKLFELSYEYDAAVSKQLRIQNGSKEVMTEKEEFLVRYFYLALLFEESHQIFYATNSLQLLSFPAHYSYKQISDLLGRKKGFKYNFLITQRIMELYRYFRKQQHFLIVGSSVYEDDKTYMDNEMHFDKDAIPAICNLGKYCFSVIDIQKFQNKSKGSVKQIKAYRSPCGQPKERELELRYV